MNENEIMCKAIYAYGALAQERQAIEECAELITAISHKHRGRPSNVAEEIADVEIMIAQLKIINACAEEVCRIRAEKLERLAERLSVK